MGNGHTYPLILASEGGGGQEIPTGTEEHHILSLYGCYSFSQLPGQNLY